MDPTRTVPAAAAAAANQSFNLSNVLSAFSVFSGLAANPPAAAAAVELEPAGVELERAAELELEPATGIEAAVLAPPWLGWSVTDDNVMGGVSAGAVEEEVTQTDANLLAGLAGLIT